MTQLTQHGHVLEKLFCNAIFVCVYVGYCVVTSVYHMQYHMYCFFLSLSEADDDLFSSLRFVADNLSGDQVQPKFKKH